jgi:dTDP-4-dehydrorhamnose 3,5-epimerase
LKRFNIQALPEVLPFIKDSDERGYFSSPFGRTAISKLDSSQLYISLSFTNLAYTIRGMHFQSQPFSESKLLKVISGSILDVVISLDDSLPLSERIHKFNLSEKDEVCLYIPKGYAHGYQTLTDNVLLMYALDSEYSKSHTRGFSPMSPALTTIWPAAPTYLKPEDLLWPQLN